MVELGSGCGLVGLVLACLGAHVLLTDLPHVLVMSQSKPCCRPHANPVLSESQT